MAQKMQALSSHSQIACEESMSAAYAGGRGSLSVVPLQRSAACCFRCGLIWLAWMDKREHERKCLAVAKRKAAGEPQHQLKPPA